MPGILLTPTAPLPSSRVALILAPIDTVSVPSPPEKVISPRASPSLGTVLSVRLPDLVFAKSRCGPEVLAVFLVIDNADPVPVDQRSKQPSNHFAR